MNFIFLQFCSMICDLCKILSKELLEDNNRLRDANGRLTISYGKLKTDYNQIVDDLRTLKNKYNTFKVDHAKTEARLRQFQSESQDYEREINELSHRYKLLNELKDKITQGIDSKISSDLMDILNINDFKSNKRK